MAGGEAISSFRAKSDVPTGTVPSKNNKGRDILRLLDANLNRCREGLRVLEDSARFVWDDETLFQEFRELRHRADALTRRFYPRLIASRNSEEDRGRTIKETGKRSVASVAYANFRRCEESLRVLEEYGKIFGAAQAKAFKDIRFRMYDLEKEALSK
jgi:thiamine-phosphate pyrophosphorylase